eukprot:gene20276-27036_t
MEWGPVIKTSSQIGFEMYVLACVMMVTEYMGRGPVIKTNSQMGFDRLDEEIAKDYFRQICLGLDYLHFNGVDHQGPPVQPQDLMQSSLPGTGNLTGVIKDPQASSKISGTPAFQAPEIVQGRNSFKHADPKLVICSPDDCSPRSSITGAASGKESPFAGDIWALGVCLYCFICGRLPFMGSCLLDINHAIVHGNLSFPLTVALTPDLRDLFDRLFLKDPAQRITMEGANPRDLLDCLCLKDPTQRITMEGPDLRDLFDPLFLNNPAQGITLEQIMEHPWVTSDGLYALKSMNAIHEHQPVRTEITSEDEQQAIACPTLVSLIRAKMKEKTYQDGVFMFHQGDEAHVIYMIMSGVVEQLPVNIKNTSKPTDILRPHSTKQTHGRLAATPCILDLQVDIDDSFLVDFVKDTAATRPELMKDGMIHVDRTQAVQLKKRMAGLMHMDENEYVKELKGPGQVLGEVSLNNIARHKQSARCKGPVTVVTLTEENFMKAMLQMYGKEVEVKDGLNQEQASMLVMQGVEGEYGGSGMNVLPPGPLPSTSETYGHNTDTSPYGLHTIHDRHSAECIGGF